MYRQHHTNITERYCINHDAATSSSLKLLYANKNDKNLQRVVVAGVRGVRGGNRGASGGVAQRTVVGRAEADGRHGTGHWCGQRSAHRSDGPLLGLRGSERREEDGGLDHVFWASFESLCVLQIMQVFGQNLIDAAIGFFVF